MSKIVLDATGGDHPAETIAGVSSALDQGYVEASQILLTGPEATVRESLRQQGLGDEIEVVDAPDVLTAGDSPTDGMRKKPRNSIAVGVGLVREGKAGAFVSAGSTGMVVAAATLGLRKLEGIRRPGIGAIIHGEKHPFLVLDVGANPQPKAHHLAQYALMGSAYYGGTFDIDEPRVGLLNIGSEEVKGNPLVREARELMKQMPICFAGNVEGVEVFSGDCHVIVTDGFSGNVLLKVSEGVAEYLLRTMFGLMKRIGVAPELMQQVHAEVMPRVDFSEYGGALLLGVEGVVTICHGRSRAPAFANALRFANRALNAKVNEHIVRAAGSVRLQGSGSEDVPDGQTANRQPHA